MKFPCLVASVLDTVVHWMIQKDEIAEELFRQRPRKRMKGQYQFSGRLTALRE
ncbi:MAG: hypothetical protein GX307_00660 [Euryarchaeota archaeon]|nr:hypothetical protein [Euryarchaeota archaeon]